MSPNPAAHATPVAQVTWSYEDSPADEMITDSSGTANGGVYVAP